MHRYLTPLLEDWTNVELWLCDERVAAFFSGPADSIERNADLAVSAEPTEACPASLLATDPEVLRADRAAAGLEDSAP